MERRAIGFLAAATLFVPAVLFLDGPGVPRQFLLGAATAALLAFFAVRLQADVRQIAVAICVATLGECILSIACGLYTYRNALLPAYVPFGHGMFYLLAAVTARQNVFRRHADAFFRVVLVGGTLYAIANFVVARDQWGLVWWIIAATLIVRSRSRLLLSVCFVYTVALELAGTAIGNWRWAADVPFIGMHSANPPSGVGLLYVLLDLITVAICTRREFAVQAPRSDDLARSST